MNMFTKSFLILTVFFCYNSASTPEPIIGILSQKTFTVQKVLDEQYDSFIAASYVKFLESAGARVIPVWIGQNEEYYVRVVNYTNGVFFPGGGTYFNESGGYGEAARTIYKIALRANQNGIYYPVWGTCLGLQVLAFAAVGEDIRVDCSLKKISIPLDYTDDLQNSRLFSQVTPEVISTLRSQNVSYNQHRYCLTEDVLEKNGILQDWRIISTNRDVHGLTFISSMEHKKYPIYGVQFHPEKNAYEFKDNIGISHDSSGIRAMQYFPNFFVDECRKNGNSFPNKQMELDTLIYNFNTEFTGKKNGTYQQIYLFKQNDFSRVQLL